MDRGIRQYTRYPVEGMGIFARTLYETETELSDISVTGACIKTKESLRIDDKHLIRLEIGDRDFLLSGIVIWEKPVNDVTGSIDDLAPFQKAGIQFKNITSEKLVMLKDFIRLSGIPEQQKVNEKSRPGALRFKIRSNERATLYFLKNHAVKKISLGGMLIGTNYDIPVEKKYPMSLCLADENITIRFQGRVASCIEKTDEVSKKFDIGIEFLDMSQNDRSRLLSLIYDL